MTARDPRLDPKVEDVVESEDGKVRRTVDRVIGRGMIIEYFWTGSVGRDGLATFRGRKRCKLEDWRRWSRERNAKIVKHGILPRHN
jgi:hypothetical protein